MRANRGEHISTVEEFAAGQDVRIEYLISAEQIAPTLRRLANSLRAPRTYDALTNNCEMFVNRMLGNPSSSPQLAGVVALLGITALVSFAAG